MKKSHIEKVIARLENFNPWESDLALAVEQVTLLERRSIVEKSLKILQKYAPKSKSLNK